MEAAKKGARPSARRGNFYQAAKHRINRKLLRHLVGQSLKLVVCKAHLTAQGVTLARPRARRLTKVGRRNLEQTPRQMLKIGCLFAQGVTLARPQISRLFCLGSNMYALCMHEAKPIIIKNKTVFLGAIPFNINQRPGTQFYFVIYPEAERKA